MFRELLTNTVGKGSLKRFMMVKMSPCNEWKMSWPLLHFHAIILMSIFQVEYPKTFSLLLPMNLKKHLGSPKYFIHPLFQPTVPPP